MSDSEYPKQNHRKYAPKPQGSEQEIQYGENRHWAGDKCQRLGQRAELSALYKVPDPKSVINS